MRQNHMNYSNSKINIKRKKKKQKKHEEHLKNKERKQNAATNIKSKCV